MKKKRLNALLCLYSFCALCLVLKAISICFVNGENYTKSVAAQRVSAIDIKNIRGRFLDRSMVPLVEDSMAEYKIDKNGRLSKEEGISIPALTERYGKGSPAPHLIGYTDGDGKGVTGLEKTFDSYISSDGFLKLNAVTSADGRILTSMGMSFGERKSGPPDVGLTIDVHIQKIAENVLRSHNMTGAAVVLDCESFDVLAMASTPAYDRNNIADCLYLEGGELINRCVMPYNAGSIFKIVTLSAAMERCLTRGEYFCEGSLEAFGHSYRCHDSTGHGFLTPQGSFAKSCNCAFYAMGLDLGAAAIVDAAHSFGLGGTLLRGYLSEESAGNLPKAEECSAPDAINLAIGQGRILLTPLQAANIACIVANRGEAKSINIADALYTDDGRLIKSFRMDETHRVLSLKTADSIADAMRLAVTDGTGRAADSPVIRAAGKTGTAETGWIKDGQRLVHGWFCGYFPYDKPRYAMAVLWENGGSGSSGAAPVFGQIAEEILKIYPIG